MSKRITNIVWWLLVFLILVVACILRLYHLDFGLPQRLHPDEWSQVEIALAISQGDLNPHFFRYPSGMMYLLAACFKVLLAISPGTNLADLYLAGRAISVLFGVGTVGLVIAWGSLLWGRWPGLAAGGLMAILATHVLHAHYATVDVLVTFWSAAALLAITRAVLQSDERWLYLASLFTGLAIGVKYNAALLLLPLVIAWIDLPPKSNLSSLKRPRRMAWVLLACGTALILVSTWLLAQSSALLSLFTSLTTDGVVESEYVSLLRAGSIAPGLLGLLMLVTAGLLFKWPGWAAWPRLFRWSNLQPLLIVLFVFSLSSPFFWIEWRHSIQDVLYEARHMQIGSAAQYAEGTLHYQETAASAPAAFPAIGSIGQLVIADFGWVGFLLVLPGMLGLWQQSRLLAVLLVGLLLLTILLTGTWVNWSTRYFLPVYPLLAILCAGGIFWVDQRLRRFQPAVRWGALVLLVLVLLALPLRRTQRVLADFSLPDTRELALSWMNEHLPEGAILVRDSYTPDFAPLANRWTILEATPYVLAVFTPEDLENMQLPYVITTFDPGQAGATAWVSQERMKQFLSIYHEVAVFRALPVSASGRTIYLYKANHE